jgi:hypothetical protein
MGEAAFELQVGAAQGGLGIHFKMSRKVRGGEQEVARLARQRLRRSFSNLRLDLGEFLPDLRQDRADVAPVETDFAGFLLQFQGARDWSRSLPLTPGLGRASPTASTGLIPCF